MLHLIVLRVPPLHTLLPESTRSCHTPGTWTESEASAADASLLPWTAPHSGKVQWGRESQVLSRSCLRTHRTCCKPGLLHTVALLSTALIDKNSIAEHSNAPHVYMSTLSQHAGVDNVNKRK